MSVKDEARRRGIVAGDDNCPVSALVTEAQRLIDAHNALNEELPPLDKSVEEKNHILETGGRLNFLLDEIEARASILQATSARGALFQICIASYWLELLSDNENPGNGRRAEMLERILYALAAFIENIAGERQENALRLYYMPRSAASVAPSKYPLALRWNEAGDR